MARTGRPKGKENRPLTEAQIRRNITFLATGVFADGGRKASQKMNESGTHPFSNPEIRKKYQHKINEANRGRVKPPEQRKMISIALKKFYASMSEEERKQKLGKGGLKLRGIKHTSERIEKNRQSHLNYVASLTEEQRKEKYGREKTKEQIENWIQKMEVYKQTKEYTNHIQSMIEENGDAVLMYYFDSSKKDGKGEFIHEFPSRNNIIKKTGLRIEHMLSKKAKNGIASNLNDEKVIKKINKLSKFVKLKINKKTFQGFYFEWKYKNK